MQLAALLLLCAACSPGRLGDEDCNPCPRGANAVPADNNRVECSCSGGSQSYPIVPGGRLQSCMDETAAWDAWAATHCR